MKLIYANDDIATELDMWTPSIFLAGPTPRSKEVNSWRPDAVKVLETLGYKGQVLIPERGNWEALESYLNQVDWEDYGLLNADVIAFWVPRDMATMPALTTNVEFGRFASDSRTVYGRPEGAPHTRYLDWLFGKYNSKPIGKTLENTMRLAMDHLPLIY